MWFCAILCYVVHLIIGFGACNKLSPDSGPLRPCTAVRFVAYIDEPFLASPYTRRQSRLDDSSMTQGLACPNAALTSNNRTISHRLLARSRSGRTVPRHRASCVNVAKPQAEASTNAHRAAVSPAQTRQQSKQTKRKEGILSSHLRAVADRPKH